MKYVMFEVINDDIKQFVPVVFPNLFVHSIMADYFGVALREHGLNVKVRSAGEVRLGSRVRCSGSSSTLDVSSHADDAMIIETFDYAFGFVDDSTQDDGDQEFVAAVVAKAYAMRDDQFETGPHGELTLGV